MTSKMKPGQRGKLQWAITHHGRREGWFTDLKAGEMLSVKKCLCLIKEFDSNGHEFAGKKYCNDKGVIGKEHAGNFFADYCALRGIQVSGPKKKAVSVTLGVRPGQSAGSVPRMQPRQGQLGYDGLAREGNSTNRRSGH